LLEARFPCYFLVNFISLHFSLASYAASKQLGNLLSLCREIAGARDILQKFEKTTRVEFQLMIWHF
jgi:hypothetical protein